MMDLYDGKFRQNGGCGYVLKPAMMRQPGFSISKEAVPLSPPQLLRIRVNRSYICLRAMFVPLGTLMHAISTSFARLISFARVLFCAVPAVQSRIDQSISFHLRAWYFRVSFSRLLIDHPLILIDR